MLLTRIDVKISYIMEHLLKNGQLKLSFLADKIVLMEKNPLGMQQRQDIIPESLLQKKYLVLVGKPATHLGFGSDMEKFYLIMLKQCII